MPTARATTARAVAVPGDLLWYAAYGSNMSAERLGCYLNGGLPTGGRHPQRGARDTSPARDARALRLPLRLRFADRSRVWGGGKAFLDPTRSGVTLARAWLVTRAQFADLSAQESGRDADDDAVDRLLAVAAAPAGQAGGGSSGGAGGGAGRPASVVLGDGAYDRLLLCGHLDGRPVVTFTHPGRPLLRAPAPAYLRMLAVGLAEAHGLRVDGIAVYLAGAAGIGRSAVEIGGLLAASGAATDQQPDRASTPDVVHPLDGQQFVSGAVDPAREDSR